MLRYHLAWKRRDLEATLAIYQPRVRYHDFFQNRCMGLAELRAYISGTLPRQLDEYLEHVAALILGQDNKLTRQPWVLADSPLASLPRWEPEPLRWLGYNAIIQSFVHEDRVLADLQAPRWRRQMAWPVAWNS